MGGEGIHGKSPKIILAPDAERVKGGKKERPEKSRRRAVFTIRDGGEGGNRTRELISGICATSKPIFYKGFTAS